MTWAELKSAFTANIESTYHRAATWLDEALSDRPEDVKRAVGTLRGVLKPETEIGFHSHNNMGMGIANSIAAIEEGASRIDASVAGLGAGAGNTPLEVFAAVCERMGIVTGCDLFNLMDMA